VTSLKGLASRRSDDEQGFTLIELMVVVLIIAILIAIAIPTFLGARQRAQDRAAQSDLRNALTAEKTEYTDTQVYSASVPTMKAIESSLQWGGKLTFNVGDVAVGAAVTGAVVCLQEQSKSGTTFALVDIAAGTNAGTYYGKAALASCDDSNALVGTLASSW
jgi:type IV pilus assembly protein PilA